jgi:4-amino-4-deoxy-L-arabinose transferase-like glycosyltransferase
MGKKKSKKLSSLPEGKKRFKLPSQAYYILFFLVLIFSAYLRFNHLTADPPENLSWSLSPFTDEGHVVINARDKLFFGQWNLDDFFRMGISSLVTVSTYIVFKIFGYGFAQARSITIFFSLLSILFLFLVVKKEMGRKFALFGSVFLAFNYVYLMHNRLAMEETPMLFFILLCIFFWQMGKEISWFFLLSGFSLAVATFFVKILALFFIPVLILDFLRFKWSSLRYEFRLKKFKPIFYLGVGFLCGFLIWLFSIYLPYKTEVTNYIIANSFKSPAGKPGTFFEFLKNFLRLGESDRLFGRMPIVFILVFFYLLYWVKDFKSKFKNYSSLRQAQGGERSRTTIEFISVIWFFWGMIFLASTNYHPIRYQMILIPPLCILAGLALGKLTELKEIKIGSSLKIATLVFWWIILFVFSYGLIYLWLNYILRNYQSFIPLVSTFTSDVRGWFYGKANLLSNHSALSIRAIILAFIILGAMVLSRSLKKLKYGLKITPIFKIFFVGVILLLFFIIQLNQYQSWSENVSYSLYDISRDLRSLPPGSAIAGPWAGAVCMENDHYALVMQAFANKDRVLERFKITHLIIFKGGWEDKYFSENYPEVMKNAVLLRQYIVRGNPLLLYKI